MLPSPPTPTLPRKEGGRFRVDFCPYFFRMKSTISAAAPAMIR